MKAKSTLKDFEEDVLLARSSGESLQVIGQRYGVSREAVRQFIDRRGGVDIVKSPHRFSLSAAGRDGNLKYFGSYATEKEAHDYFCSKVPLSPDVVAYSVYAKGESDGRRLWHSVIMEGDTYRKVGVPSYSVESARKIRQGALNVPLTAEAEELTHILGPTEVLRNSLSGLKVVKSKGSFEIFIKEEEPSVSPEDQFAKLINI